MVAQEAVVGVTNLLRLFGFTIKRLLAAFCVFQKLTVLAISFSIANSTFAATLSEERADIMYHSYDGGGIEITGPSILVRKNFKERVSVYGNYYVDQISSASIDVITSGASRYAEKRTEVSVGTEYLHDKTKLSLSGTTSEENDYEAETLTFGISQDFFGDMTTLSLGYSYGDDIVRNITDPDFEKYAQHRKYRFGLTQVITPKLIMGLSAETVNDQGFLNNPYRFIRIIKDGKQSRAGELYPNTRNSDAYGFRIKYFLPFRAALGMETRVFTDNWGIESNNSELNYIHPYKDQWTFATHLRTYSQTQASFFSDSFSYLPQQDFMARDKEMSEFDAFGFGLGVKYDVRSEWLSFFDKVTVNFKYDYIHFDYKTFRDMSQSMGEGAAFSPGEEPFYELKANVIRFFISAYY